MTLSIRSRYLPSLAGCAALIYTLLLVMGTGCALVHADQVQPHQHHHSDDGSSSQTAFCVWACQVTVDTTVASGPQPAGTELMLGPADFFINQLVSTVRSFSDRTRAPPTYPLASLV